MCALALAAVSGCVTIPVGYQKPEVVGARYFHDTCGGFGAPEVAYFPYHRIFVSVALVGGYNLALGLHVPPGATARLEGENVDVSGRTTRGDFVVKGVLRAVRHGSFGNWLQRSRPFLWQPDPYRSAANVGLLRGGGTASRGYLWYLFAAFPSSRSTRLLDLPGHVVRGVIRLPPITVKGARYPGLVIPFEKRERLGVMPVNC